MTNPIPKGFHTITPSIIVKDADKAIEFYKKAFGAEEIVRCFGQDGKTIMHSEIKIGDSIIMISDEFPQMNCVGPQTLGGTAVSMYLYVTDADAWYDKAIQAGAIAVMPVGDMFWGDRWGQVADPFGHKWSIATHKKDMTAEELKKAQEVWQKEYAACGQK